jgi:hypothetical protein
VSLQGQWTLGSESSGRSVTVSVQMKDEALWFRPESLAVVFARRLVAGGGMATNWALANERVVKVGRWAVPAAEQTIEDVARLFTGRGGSGRDRSGFGHWQSGTKAPPSLIWFRQCDRVGPSLLWGFVSSHGDDSNSSGGGRHANECHVSRVHARSLRKGSWPRQVRHKPAKEAPPALRLSSSEGSCGR